MPNCGFNKVATLLNISWPWTLFGSRVLIMFKISYVENSTVESD